MMEKCETCKTPIDGPGWTLYFQPKLGHVDCDEPLGFFCSRKCLLWYVEEMQ